MYLQYNIHYGFCKMFIYGSYVYLFLLMFVLLCSCGVLAYFWGIVLKIFNEKTKPVSSHAFVVYT